MSGTVEDLFTDFGISPQERDRLHHLYGLTVFDMPFILSWQLLTVGMTNAQVSRTMSRIRKYNAKEPFGTVRRVIQLLAAGEHIFDPRIPLAINFNTYIQYSNDPSPTSITGYLAWGTAGTGQLRYINTDEYTRDKIQRLISRRCRQYNAQVHKSGHDRINDECIKRHIIRRRPYHSGEID
jgi:hypothetical protein